MKYLKTFEGFEEIQNEIEEPVEETTDSDMESIVYGSGDWEAELEEKEEL